VIRCEKCYEKTGQEVWFFQITGGHLRAAHSINAYEYQREFPKALMIDYDLQTKISNAISEANTGHETSDETRNKISKSKLAYYSKNEVSEETRQKLSEANTGHKVSDETREKMSTSSRKYWDSEEGELARQRIGEYHTEKIVSEETRERMSISSSNRPTRSDETRKRQSESIRSYWKSPEGIKQKIKMAEEQSTPEYRKKLNYNQSEQAIDLILQTNFPGEYKYSGEEGESIGTKKPDFLHTSKPKIIEFFGDHWHKNYEVPILEHYYAGLGYSLLVIWSHDLRAANKDAQKLYELVKQIKEFTDG